MSCYFHVILAVSVINGYAYSVSTSLSNVEQFSYISNLYMNDRFWVNDSKAHQYIQMYPELFYDNNGNIELNSEDDWIIMDGVTFIFLPDHFMCHLFHIMEHILGMYAMYYSQFSDSKDVGFIRAIFPMSDEKHCYGKYNINKLLLSLIYPGIKIICGNEWNEFIDSNDYVLIKNAFVSMRVINYENIGLNCKDWKSCIWNKMLGNDMDIIKEYSNSFRQNIFNNLRLKNVDNNVIKIVYVSRKKTKNRKLTDNARNELINALKNHPLFGNKNMFEISELLLENYSFYEQIELISNANIIIGVHGNGLSHVIWLGNNYKPKMLIELIPQNVRINDYMLFSDIVNIFHFQFDVYNGEFIYGSHNFSLCSPKYYKPSLNPDKIINKIHNIHGLTTKMEEIWKYINNKTDILPNEFYLCNNNYISINDDVCSITNNSKEYSNNVC